MFVINYKIRIIREINKLIYSELSNILPPLTKRTRSGGSRCFLGYIYIPFCRPPSGAGRPNTHCGRGMSSWVGLGCWESLRRVARAGTGSWINDALDAGSPA